MMAGGISEGDWVYRRPYLGAAFTAYDRRTEITHDTSAMTIQDARAFTDAHDASTQDPATVPAGRPAVTYTIERGSRARGGHQRYRGGEERSSA